MPKTSKNWISKFTLNIPMKTLKIQVKKTWFQIWLNPFLKSIESIAKNWISKISFP